jgi:polysaccharide biosynthesis/export protein
MLTGTIAGRAVLSIVLITGMGCAGDAFGAERQPRAKKSKRTPARQAAEESKAAAATSPRELAMQPLPDYQIEPPDLLQIEVLKLVPRQPYRLAIYDVLQIQVVNTLADQPIDGFFLVEADDGGTVNLGAAYGTVRVAGMTLEEVRKATLKHLKQILKNPEISVELSRTASMQPVTGMYLVGPDGTINFRQYGKVQVMGKTIAQAKAAVEKQLAKYFQSPAVTIDVAGYNSKVYYIVTQGAGLGDNVVRVPITGNDTVLDAISQIGGLSQLSSKKIWIARPSASNSDKGTILKIDWDSIVQRGATATNYQIMPRDRLFIAEDKLLSINNAVGKATQPVERILGTLGLAASTIEAIQKMWSQSDEN